jgi:hypothetical protein
VPLNRQDQALIETFLEVTRNLSPEIAGEAVGVSGMTVRRWRERLPSRVETENRLRLTNYLQALSDVVSREKEEQRRMESDMAEGQDPIEQLLDVMGVEGGLRRAFREYQPADLVKLVYRVGIDDGWPADKMAKIDALRGRILGT